MQFPRQARPLVVLIVTRICRLAGTGSEYEAFTDSVSIKKVAVSINFILNLLLF